MLVESSSNNSQESHTVHWLVQGSPNSGLWVVYSPQGVKLPLPLPASTTYPHPCWHRRMMQPAGLRKATQHLHQCSAVGVTCWGEGSMWQEGCYTAQCIHSYRIPLWHGKSVQWGCGVEKGACGTHGLTRCTRGPYGVVRRRVQGRGTKWPRGMQPAQCGAADPAALNHSEARQPCSS